MVTTTEMSIDEKVQRDVLDELHFDHMVRPTDVGVEVDDGIVTLTGTVDTYPKRRAAANGALRVFGVRGVVNNIEVEPPLHGKTDTEIAEAAAQALIWDTSVPEHRVKVRVSHGWVTLEGTVDWYSEYEAAERAVERLTGVRGVSNSIEIEPGVESVPSASEITDKIERALLRSAEIDARRIHIRVDGHRVIVSGTIRSWCERNRALQAIWATPGVSSVTDHLQVIP